MQPGAREFSRPRQPSSFSLPSSSLSTRSQAAASRGLWVAMIDVRPRSACISRSSACSASAVCSSRSPVGSSASSSAGCITSARAIATRCCSPPDSIPGRCVRRSRRPTRSSSARRPAGRARPPATPRDAQRHLGVLERGELRQQVMELEDEADVAVAERHELRVGHDRAASRVADPDRCRRRSSRARRARAAACSCRRPTRRRSRPSRPSRPRGRGRAARCSALCPPYRHSVLRRAPRRPSIERPCVY